MVLHEELARSLVAMSSQTISTAQSVFGWVSSSTPVISEGVGNIFSAFLGAPEAHVPEPPTVESDDTLYNAIHTVILLLVIMAYFKAASLVWRALKTFWDATITVYTVLVTIVSWIVNMASRLGLVRDQSQTEDDELNECQPSYLRDFQPQPGAVWYYHNPGSNNIVPWHSPLPPQDILDQAPQPPPQMIIQAARPPPTEDVFAKISEEDEDTTVYEEATDGRSIATEGLATGHATGDETTDVHATVAATLEAARRNAARDSDFVHFEEFDAAQLAASKTTEEGSPDLDTALRAAAYNGDFAAWKTIEAAKFADASDSPPATAVGTPAAPAQAGPAQAAPALPVNLEGANAPKVAAAATSTSRKRKSREETSEESSQEDEEPEIRRLSKKQKLRIAKDNAKKWADQTFGTN